MEQMTDRLNAILQDPEAMAQIQSLASSMFGGGGNASATNAAAPPVSAPPPVPERDGLSPDMVSMMTRLAPMLQNMRKETPDTQLLHALRPLLSPPRQKKLDDALKLLQLMSVLPMLQHSGLLKGLL